MVTIGFTGTQKGMTKKQLKVFSDMIANQDITLRNGQCIGADHEAYLITLAINENNRVILHPPVVARKRFKEPKNERVVTLDEKPYLDRNRDIVDGSSLLIATPDGIANRLRSGTWATIRYAVKKGKRIIIIYPDGYKKFVSEDYEARKNSRPKSLDHPWFRDEN